jgi:hypothetical protein
MCCPLITIYSQSNVDITRGAKENGTNDKPLLQTCTIQDVPDKLIAGQSSKYKECYGEELLVSGRKVPAWSYPFGLHKLHSVPWDVIVKGDGLVVKSTACHTMKISNPSAIACTTCSDLLRHTLLQGVLERVEHGVHEHTRHEYLNTNLHELLLRKNEQINALKLSRLNLERSLAARARPLEAFKRFVIAVGKGDIPCLHQLVSAAHKNGSSIYAIMEKIDMATRQAYHPNMESKSDLL